MAGAGGVRANALRGAMRDLTRAGLPDKAAPLAFYGALCVLGALTSLIALLGLAGSHPETSNAVLDVVRDLRNSSDAGAFEGPVEDLFADKQLAMLLLVGGLAATAAATALYLRAFRRVARPLTGHQEAPDRGRGPLGVLARVLVAELIVLAGLCVIVSGSLAHSIGDVAGLSTDAVVSWDIVKWPLLFLMTFAAFAALQRSAFSDPRVLAASSVTSSQVFAVLAWAFAITGFALYLASFDTFENTYGTIGSGIVLLVWITMFTMLYYVTPDFHVSGVAALGAGAALSTVTWLAANAVLAVGIAALAPVDGGIAMLGIGVIFLAGLWVANIVVLLAVRLNALGVLWADAVPVAEPVARPARVSRKRTRDEDLVRAVGRALQNDVAHDGMLSPIALAEEETAGMSDLELDLADWGFTYGVAWATARAQAPEESEEQVAERALGAAREVFRMYCGHEGWEQQIRDQLRRRRPPKELVADRIDGAAGNGHGGYELLR
ncbi:MAG TPA: YihY/virulence factor BrkB family protein [Solirubrobacterales bacterium]|nr:YihY/virulence factor BrkB family protein [Solirubrobacterales bacterium]